MYLYYLPILLGCVALVVALTAKRRTQSVFGMFIGLGALVFAGMLWFEPSIEWVDNILFLVFAGVAIGASGCMVTSRDPVYSALWFALVTLSVCGLFVIQAAAFLAAATTIVYAGAIIVTFLFVIMLARQAGKADYDRRSNQPLFAAAIAFVLLCAMLVYLDNGQVRKGLNKTSPAQLTQLLPIPAGLEPNALSRPASGESFGTMRGLGRSLFGDYLYSVELAGTLLLLAAIAAIAISPKRVGGHL